MPKDLERDLGLYATVTVSIGAMIGSGIFVLPGLASAKTGPSVVLAYLLAGFIVLPAALSKAEMATAMPEAGGTYLYIDRAMGPLPGTVAGIGAWFSLVFKSAFALVGLGAYLLVLIDLPAGGVKAVGVVLAAIIVVVNVVGVKQTGRLQAAIVTVVLLALVGFIADGITYVDAGNYHPFFTHGSGGLLAATGFVFVSYAGVTKIASVAEEVEDPGRNIPLGIVASVVAMMIVYTLVIFVVVGVAPPAPLRESLTPMALAAGDLLGGVGTLAVTVVAVLALTSMANAGVLSSSRFPLAMARDDLAPEQLGRVSDRFRTPTYAIAITGALLVALIAAVPVADLAKLASAFKILVFTFVNVALVAFRESEAADYDPEFVAPAYPWLQLAGIVGGVVLLTQMEPLAGAGAVGIVAVGLLWYAVYGRDRTEREGAALDAIRREAGSRAVAQTEALAADGTDVMVVADDDTPERARTTMLVLGAAVASDRGGTVHAVKFETVPEQVSLSDATGMTEADEAFERATDEFAATLPVPVEIEEIVSHDVRRAIANHADAVDADLLLGAWDPGRVHAELLGEDVDWYMDHAPCDVAFARDRGVEGLSTVAVLTERRPFAPRKVDIAGAVAAQHGATVRFVTALPADARDEQVDSTRAFHEQLGERCTAPTESVVLRTDDTVADLAAAAEADLAVVDVFAHTWVYDLLVGDTASELADELDCTVLLVHSREPRARSFFKRLVERLAF